MQENIALAAFKEPVEEQTRFECTTKLLRLIQIETKNGFFDPIHNLPSKTIKKQSSVRENTALQLRHYNYYFIAASISSTVIGMPLNRSVFPVLVIQILFSMRMPIFSSSI